MSEPKSLALGKVIRSIGADGKLSIRLTYRDWDLLENWEPLWLKLQQTWVPFFISDYEVYKNQYLQTHLETINNQKDAEELIGEPVFLFPEKHNDQELDNDSLEQLAGYTLLNQNNEKIGVISDLISNNESYIATIDNPEQTMIPIHEDLIIEWNRENKHITIEIPDGLLDLNA